MTSTDHDSLAYRLAGILLKLNQGEALVLDDLAAEYRVSERTVYRDLNRLGGIVERDPSGRYGLVPEYRGKLSTRDLENFARLVGVEDLFPQSSASFLVALLDTLSQGSFLVRGHHYEALRPHDQTFSQLDQAIRAQRRCTLTYADKRRELEPYRLINSKGIWYRRRHPSANRRRRRRLVQSGENGSPAQHRPAGRLLLQAPQVAAAAGNRQGTGKRRPDRHQPHQRQEPDPAAGAVLDSACADIGAKVPEGIVGDCGETVSPVRLWVFYL